MPKCFDGKIGNEHYFKHYIDSKSRNNISLFVEWLKKFDS